MLVICGVRQKEGGEDFESCWCFRLNVRWLAGWSSLSLALSSLPGPCVAVACVGSYDSCAFSFIKCVCSF